MKKIVAYMATGILLGVVVMLLPLNLTPKLSPGITLTGETSDQYSASPTKPKNVEIDKVDSIGIFPSSLLYAGLVSAIGLVFALGVYALFKKRVIS